MTERSVTHGTFTLERVYDASPERVFHAISDPAAKARWFVGPEGSESTDYELDFRVGGREHISGGPEGGPHFTYDAVIADIVPNERIVTTYEMSMDGNRISVSVGSFELAPEGSGTKVVLTELGAYLDGFDEPGIREKGTSELLDKLGAALAE